MKLLFVDTETVNVNRDACGIYQIAGVLVSVPDGSGVDKGEVLEKFNLKMCPPENEVFDQDCIDSGNVTKDEILSYPPSSDVFSEFVDILARHINRFDKTDKCFIVAYNAAFDSNKIRNWFIENDDNYYGSWFWSNTICVMNLASYLLRFDRHKLPNFKLGTLCAALGIKLDDAHDAFADVVATVELYSVLESYIMGIEDSYENEIYEQT